MKYEFILKIKDAPHDAFHEKFRNVCSKERFDRVKKDFEDYIERNRKEYFDAIILINQLNDNGEFETTIQ